MAAAAAAQALAQQQFIHAQQAVQLSILPSFSNRLSADKFSPTQWLQKVLTHKSGARWTDEQTITHFRNALRDKVIDWFDTLADYGLDTTVWETIQTQFEIDYKAKPTATTIVSQLPDISQKQDESVNEYFSRAMKILAELKRQVDPTTLPTIPPNATEEQQEAWDALADDVKTLFLENAIAVAARGACDIYSSKILTAGLRPYIRSKVLGMENVNTPLQIKVAATRIEMLESEKKNKVTVVHEAAEVNAVKPKKKKTKAKGQQASTANAPNNMSHSSTNGIPANRQQAGGGTQANTPRPTCEHCNRFGHTMERCFFKFPHLRPRVNNLEGQTPTTENTHQGQDEEIFTMTHSKN